MLGCSLRRGMPWMRACNRQPAPRASTRGRFGPARAGQRRRPGPVAGLRRGPARRPRGCRTALTGDRKVWERERERVRERGGGGADWRPEGLPDALTGGHAASISGPAAPRPGTGRVKRGRDPQRLQRPLTSPGRGGGGGARGQSTAKGLRQTRSRADAWVPASIRVAPAGAGAGGPCSPWSQGEAAVTALSAVVAVAYVLFSLTTTLLSFEVLAAPFPHISAAKLPLKLVQEFARLLSPTRRSASVPGLACPASSQKAAPEGLYRGLETLAALIWA